MTFYLYAIVDRRPSRPELLGNGMTRKPLALARAGKAFVVVERAESPAPTRPAIVAHDRVVRRLARLFPAVLPLRFGAVAADQAAIRALIAPLAEPLEQAFERVHGAVQLTLRVSGRRLRAPAVDRRAGPGTRWLAKRMARHRVPEVACVTEATRSFVRAVRAERHDRGPFIATVYHLVAREDVRRWRRAVEEALGDLPRGVEVTTTGPWPPWAFAELA